MLSLKRKNASITGGDSRTGPTIAKLFAAQGAVFQVIESNLQPAKGIQKIATNHGRMWNRLEVAALALDSCSNETSFVFGCDYPVDGGLIWMNN